MAKNNGKPASETKHVDMPQRLADALLRAEAGCFPTFTDEEQALCPELHAILSPQLVNDPKHKGQGDPRKILREPMLLVSWDRGGGAWKWSITDKTLNLGWDGPLPSLVGIAEAVEACLVQGRFRIRKKKVT